ncbi:MAG: helical backbone metal receptor [Acidimicrobiales bacterium]
MKIISLVPSATETLVSWGCSPLACTRYCEQPDLPHVGGTKDPDIERIVELRPDLVVMEAEENRREDHDSLVHLGVPVHVMRIRSLEDVNPTMERLARRVGAAWEPALPREPRADRFSAFVPIWRRPWMALGMPTYGGSVLASLGVSSVYNHDDGPYPAVELSDAISRSPDVVLAPSEPYPFSSRQLPELQSVAPTTFIDGKDLFWWGSRTPGAIERLSAVLDRISTTSGVDVTSTGPESRSMRNGCPAPRALDR